MGNCRQRAEPESASLMAHTNNFPALMPFPLFSSEEPYNFTVLTGKWKAQPH